MKSPYVDLAIGLFCVLWAAFVLRYVRGNKEKLPLWMPPKRFLYLCLGIVFMGGLILFSSLFAALR